MKMLEEILAKGTADHLNLEGLREAAHSQLEVFLIDNVAEYLYAQTDQEEWRVKDDFPCLAPPFPDFWMEYGRPSRLLSRDYGVRTSEGLPYRVGLYFASTLADQVLVQEDFSPDGQGYDRLKQERDRSVEYLNVNASSEILAELRAFKESGGHIDKIEELKRLSLPAQKVLAMMVKFWTMEAALAPGGMERSLDAVRKCGGHWLLSCASFVQMQEHGPIYGPIMQQVLEIDRDGKVLEVGQGTNFKYMVAEAPNGLDTLWFPGLLAISFCHCKNVVIEREEMEHALKRKQLRRGQPVLTYRRLEIAPLKATLRGAGAESPGGLKRALHICRGHFAVYQDKGLFGKYQGRFWIHQHLRGTKEAGVVVKDYEPTRKQA